VEVGRVGKSVAGKTGETYFEKGRERIGGETFHPAGDLAERGSWDETGGKCGLSELWSRHQTRRSAMTTRERGASSRPTHQSDEPHRDILLLADLHLIVVHVHLVTLLFHLIFVIIVVVRLAGVDEGPEDQVECLG
jgi:hypothetical protein